MSFEQSVYTDFFSEINGYLKNSDIFREKFNKVLSLDFNVFDFWGRYIDENRMSEILAFFLDPHASHGQNKSFLREFIRYLNEQEISGFNIDDTAVATIKLESPTDEKRRMDIHIDICNRESKFGTVIENKIGVVDQENQIKDYNSYLEKLYPKKEPFSNYHLIYLSPEGDTPSSKSIAENKFEELKENELVSCMSYRKDIIELVSRFISICESDRVRFFLSELSVYLKKRFKGEQFMDDKSEIVNFVCEDKNRVRVAFEILDTQSEIIAELINKLIGQCESKIPSSLSLTGGKNVDISKKESGISFSKDTWHNIKLEYLFTSDIKESFLGIRKVDHPKITDLKQSLKDEEINTGLFNKEVWIWTSDYLQNWNFNSNDWSEIISGKTCDNIFLIINPVARIIDNILGSE